MTITGRVYEVSPTVDVPLLSKGYIQLVSGKTYRVSADVRQSVAPGNSSGNVFTVDIWGLDSTFAPATVTATTTNVSGAQASPATLTAVQGWNTVSIDVTIGSSNVAVWGRSHLKITANTGSTVQVSRLVIEDVSESTRAKGSADAAATSASAASASETAAGLQASAAQSSATAANTSAGQASTSAGQASTSASQASTSATNASGSASNAATSATAAAGSATAAGNSATAAAGSASTASTQATNAGNSATSATTSANNAASSFTATNLLTAKLFPDRYDGTGQYFTSASGGSPSSLADLPSNATASGYGAVREEVIGSAASALFSSRAVLPATAGKIYKIEGEIQRTAITGSADGNTVVRIEVRGLDSNYSSIGVTTSTSTAYTGNVQTVSCYVSDVGSASILAWTSGSVWLRPYARAYAGGATSITVQFRRLTVTDVTESYNANQSATAAATSASSAGTQATNAGNSASAAQTSATNASTSASQAGTSATNAALSESNASTSASQASTSATTAAGSASTAATNATTATNAANAAGTSAAAAATSATASQSSANQAGISASAAQTSAVSASTSLEGTIVRASALFPESINATGDNFLASESIFDFVGDPATLSMATAAKTFITTTTTYGFVFNLTGSGMKFATRGAAATSSDIKSYQVEVDFYVSAFSGTAVEPKISIIGLNGDYTFLDVVTTAPTTITSAGIFTFKQVFSSTSNDLSKSAQWPTGSARIRPFVSYSGGSGAVVNIRRLTVKEVTSEVNTQGYAAAAATNASSAQIYQTAAGNYASSAQSSAVTASSKAAQAVAQTTQITTAIAQAFPSDFSQDGMYFTNAPVGQTPTDPTVGSFKTDVDGVRFYFTAGSMPSNVTLTRSGSATRVNSSGVLVTETSNTARFDYDPATLVLKGLMIEPASTNMLTYSQQLDTAPWSTASTGTGGPSAVTANAAISPDGTLNAERLDIGSVIGGFGASNYSVITRGSATIVASQTTTLSVWLKGIVGGEQTYLLVIDTTATVFYKKLVTLTTSWVKYSFTVTPLASSYFWIGVDHRDTTQLDLPACSFYAFGAQQEAASSASSYIATTSTTASRNADVVTLNWGARGVADGTINVRYTFDDGSTQTDTMVVSGGNATVPTTLNRSTVRKIETI